MHIVTIDKGQYVSFFHHIMELLIFFFFVCWSLTNCKFKPLPQILSLKGLSANSSCKTRGSNNLYSLLLSPMTCFHSFSQLIHLLRYKIFVSTLLPHSQQPLLSTLTIGIFFHSSFWKKCVSCYKYISSVEHKF